VTGNADSENFQDMDYGHVKYLDALQGQKAIITKALERLEHRTAEVSQVFSLWLSNVSLGSL
jgi:hypothetical protein